MQSPFEPDEDPVPNADFMSTLSDEEREQLVQNHFDEPTFRELRRRFLADELTEESNRIRGQVELPGPDDVRDLPRPGDRAFERLETIGRQALEAGEVGVLILNGGMATRFGGVVKGSVEVADGLSFLGLKLRDAARWDGQVPVLLMNSFATHDKTREHLEDNDWFGFERSRVHAFKQNISLRLTPAGALYRDAEGEVSAYAPGHGDLPGAVQREALEWFRSQGGKYLLMSNVDNVLASVDPVVVGMHVEAARERGVEMTVEAAPTHDGDKGGMPARVDGHLQVVEAFRFPLGFDATSIPVFNTNTFFFDADALARPFKLTWFVVDKQVGDDTVIQFERLAGELSSFLQAQFVRVPRDGEASRFLPIKRPEDLEESRAYLHAVMKARGIV